MPRLTKIYTRTGDDGTTALGSRQRVSKDSLRIRATGTVDEVNALLGLALAQGLSERLGLALPAIQNELFHLGAELSFPPSEEQEFEIPRIEAHHVTALEELIDELNQTLGPLENFILPGGSPGAAALQLARAVARRAERRMVSLAGAEQVRPQATAYINRLSDALFVMARYENKQRGIEEPLWDSRA
ncbi:MAG: cob(I)yrinic acid a,c-diamide adenosyltransferase [Chloroflexi bacterium]|nr:cob(I)yrinic acid a,c-diamide adenosyltransferase [Chloroflexota bacterium]